ncbi:Ribonuclease H-like domain containing protein [Melia azedarach]|uniref:Ribonuclease H-like domain containing protein n=1 Tax=Melia azedarach TaxID=155640 RepID=A0ACC1XZZ1_MELAZ|nr:Ribonuclease H-like domain containing protein [Melia azedarach]
MTLSVAESLLKAFQAGCKNKNLIITQLTTSPAMAWSPPCSGLKLNVDAAINIQKSKAGLGYIIKNSSWAVMTAMYTKKACLRSVELAEALAILEGLRMAKDSGLYLNIIESDSIKKVNHILKKTNCRGELECILAEILDFVDNDSNCNF